MEPSRLSRVMSRTAQRLHVSCWQHSRRIHDESVAHSTNGSAQHSHRPQHRHVGINPCLACVTDVSRLHLSGSGSAGISSGAGNGGSRHTRTAATLADNGFDDAAALCAVVSKGGGKPGSDYSAVSALHAAITTNAGGAQAPQQQQQQQQPQQQLEPQQHRTSHGRGSGVRFAVSDSSSGE